MIHEAWGILRILHANMGTDIGWQFISLQLVVQVQRITWRWSHSCNWWELLVLCWCKRLLEKSKALAWRLKFSSKTAQLLCNYFAYISVSVLCYCSPDDMVGTNSVECGNTGLLRLFCALLLESLYLVEKWWAVTALALCQHAMLWSRRIV